MYSIALTPILLVLTLLALALAVAQLRRRLPHDELSLPKEIDALLPQTQCAQCGHPGCMPYAEAVAAGTAIDLCPPGGPELVIRLRDLMGPDAPLEKVEVAQPETMLAVIDEAKCIGCALCLPPCPVDAIVGANGFMHTVVEQDCTGCELCIPACPVDCISLVSVPAATVPQPAKVASASRGCINCSQCVDVCPRDLAPDQLFKLANAQAWSAAADLGLQECVECSLCDRVCPSEINLTEIFTQAKRVESWLQQDNDHKLAIKQRYAEHQDRAAQRTQAAQERRAERLQRRRSRPGRAEDTQQHRSRPGRAEDTQKHHSRPGRTAETQQQHARPARAAAARNKHGRQV
tara:strand:+ start:1465 stop:2508 length:1044 start_codon:yes stop_codon:yes gene_type:complete